MRYRNNVYFKRHSPHIRVGCAFSLLLLYKQQFVGAHFFGRIPTFRDLIHFSHFYNSPDRYNNTFSLYHKIRQKSSVIAE